MTDNSLPCMNCGKPVTSDKASLFAEVYVCLDCYEQATHFWIRTERELRGLLTLARDAIRVSLLEGKFVFPEGADATELPKKAVLETILAMDVAREAREQCTTTRVAPTLPCSGTTTPRAPSAGALVLGSSHRGCQHG